MWSAVKDRPQLGIAACKGDPSATPIWGDSRSLNGEGVAANVALFGGGSRGEGVGVGKLKTSSPALKSIV